MDRVLQDPLEQQRQLAGRLVRVFLGQLQHRVLDDVERGILVPHGEHRLLEGASLDAGEEGGDFLCGSQCSLPQRESAPIIGRKRPTRRRAGARGADCAVKHGGLDRPRALPVMSCFRAQPARLLYCKSGCIRSLRRRHKRRGVPLGAQPICPIRGFHPGRSLEGCAYLRVRQMTCKPRACACRTRGGPYRSPTGGHHATHRRGNRRSAASRKKASSTSSAIRAARSSTSTTSSSSRTRSSTSSSATSRARSTRPTATRARRRRSAWRSSPPGPGVTNAVTGIATAYMDSIPMVVLTGQVPDRTRSARTRSRSATRSASRARA